MRYERYIDFRACFHIFNDLTGFQHFEYIIFDGCKVFQIKYNEKIIKENGKLYNKKKIIEKIILIFSQDKNKKKIKKKKNVGKVTEIKFCFNFSIKTTKHTTIFGNPPKKIDYFMRL